MKKDERILLPDGHWLGYAEYGAPDGEPLIYFHGARSCRHDIDFASAPCEQAGIRLIAVDRPGFGTSEFRPMRRLMDWPNDIEALADGLNIDRFALLAWSAGTPYALACAHLLGNRVTRVGLVSSLAPFDRGRTADQLGLRLDQILFPLASQSPGLAAFRLRILSHLPSSLLRSKLLQGLGPTMDRALIQSLPASDAVASFREALKSGPEGTVAEYRILGGWWAFEFESIEQEVHLWHGEQDHIHPVGHSQWFSDRLPQAQLHIIPEQGHYLLRTHLDEVLSVLGGVRRTES